MDIMVVPNELLPRWQANQMMNIELSFHVKDNSPSGNSCSTTLDSMQSFNR